MDALEQELPETNYPNIARMRALLLTSKENNVLTSVVGEVIQEIISGERTGFRHPAAPDGEPFIQFRYSIPDEDWIASAGVDEETWIANMAQMGKNVRPYLKAPAKSANLINQL